MWPPRRGQGASILCKRKALDSGLAFWQKEASGASKQQEGAGYRPQGDGARSPSDSGFTPHLRQGKRPQRPFPTLSSRAPALGPALPADGEGGKARRGSLLGGGRAGGGGGASRCLQPSNPRPGLAPPAVSPTAANSPRAPPAQGLGSAVLPHRMLCGLEQVTEPLCASVACKLQPQHRVVMKVN